MRTCSFGKGCRLPNQIEREMAPRNLSSVAKRNLDTVLQLERQLTSTRSLTERLAIGVARFFGSFGFVAAHAIAISVWIIANIELTNLPPFDPYPFPFLALIVGIEFIVLTTFVLINQKFQSWRQDQWSHLNLQVCLLSEQEITKCIQMLGSICDRLGLEKPPGDIDLKELAQDTAIPALAEAIHKAQPKSDKNLDIDEGMLR